MYKYIEVINKSNKSVVNRFNMSEFPNKIIDRIEIELNINLNHDLFYINQNESITELELITNAINKATL